MKMKMGLIAGSLFFFAASAHAQARPNQLTSGGGGGVGDVGGGAMSFSLPVIDRAHEHYTYIYEQGSNETYVPTRFVSYDAALKLGEAALAYRPKTIAEVAAEYRAEKKQAK
ncbi:MAG: hypothetical protein WAN10_05625 [Candidatus Acidiferrales bacterium]